MFQTKLKGVEIFLKKLDQIETVKILAVFVVWRLTLFGLGFIALAIMPKVILGELSFVPVNFWQTWANWDGGHFLGIAQNGFRFTQQYAFFPLLPLLIYLVRPVFGGSSLIAGLVVANFAAFLTGVLFFKLVKLDFGKDFSLKALTYFLFFPTAFFLGAIYAESIFLASVLAAFYFARKKSFLLASLSAMLATLAKPYGILVVIPLFFEYLQQGRKLKVSPRLFFLLLPVIVFIFYLFYLGNKTGDPWIFVKAQQNWLRATSNPLITFWNYYLGFFEPKFNPFLGIRLIEFGAVLLVLSLILTNWHQLRFSYLVYLVLLFAVFVSTGTFVSFQRFVLILWPVFLILANLGNNFLFDTFYKFASLPLLGLLTSLFLAGFFVG